jgi:hypothetical protein
MLWVACFELISDAIRDIPISAAAVSMSLSFCLMMAISAAIDQLTSEGQMNGH